MNGFDDLGVVDALQVADFAAASALAAADEQRAASLIEIGLGEVERFLDA